MGAKRTMRVLLIANTLPPQDLSGVGEQVLQLAAGLRARGHEVEVLGRCGHGGRGGDGARGPKVLFPLAIVRPALRKIATFRPDVVQLHESDGGLLAFWIRRLQVRPLLVALLQVSYVEERRAVRPLRHGDEVLGEPGVVERRFRSFKAPLQILLGRRTARAADLVLAPSATTAAELVRDYGARKTAVLPNASGGLVARSEAVVGVGGGVRIEEGGVPGLLFVGRLRLRKGVEVLLRALSLLRTQGDPPLSPRLRIAGEGEHREAIERAAVRFGVSDQVDFLGRRGPAEVRWLLEHSAALVVPSIYEGMPLVILEAMLAGLPVIASRVSGIPEVVLDPETGWLVTPEDPPALAAVLAELLADPAAARRRGENGRRRLEERYRPDVVAATWESIVAAAIAERSGHERRSLGSDRSQE
jgi:glycosyltransferase involved in cell wall biosynthesis